MSWKQSLQYIISLRTFYIKPVPIHNCKSNENQSIEQLQREDLGNVPNDANNCKKRTSKKFFRWDGNELVAKRTLPTFDLTLDSSKSTSIWIFLEAVPLGRQQL